MGVSFAIPIEVALEVSKQLRSEGKVTRGRLGVRIQPMTKELAQSFKLKEADGALIAIVRRQADVVNASRMITRELVMNVALLLQAGAWHARLVSTAERH